MTDGRLCWWAGATAASVLVLALVGCGAKRGPDLPPIPMDEPTATPEETGYREPSLPPGVCAPADTESPIHRDTLSVADLPSPPRLIVIPPVAYPEGERQSGWEGDVSVRLLLRPDGSVARSEVGDGRDPYLLAAAKAACGARFAPVRSRSGEPVYVWVDHTFAFQLHMRVPLSVPREDRDEW